MSRHTIAFVVPTMDRPDDLRTMLTSLAAQTRPVDQVIIVDASQPDVRAVCDEFATLPLDYVREYPPSLARQRNAGMQRVREGITLAGYLDDDIVLESEAIERMMAYWDAAGDDLGGTAFSITNAPPARWTRVKSLAGLDSPQPGRVLPSGCTSILGCQPRDLDTDWLCGGATVWRREVVRDFPYDEWFKGTGYLEDVDYSFNVRSRYRLALVAGARVAHYSRPVRPDRQALLGRWQIVNRMYLVRKYRARGLSVARAWLANFALPVLHAAQALLKGDRDAWSRARGNLHGVWDELRGRRPQLGGFLK
ncbi:MAG: glycosyltransferase family 2 protein [Burkholderiales bacterium]